MLTGPARGYVKRGLERLGVPYAHDFLEDYELLPRCYAALDYYINPSAEEGGPKGVIESMASGVPIISTSVGMAPDLIMSGVSGYLVEPGDAAGLAQALLTLEATPDARGRMTAAAREAVKDCDPAPVGRAHWNKIVRPLLAEMGRTDLSRG